jgi:integrase/recombinase XerD
MPPSCETAGRRKRQLPKAHPVLVHRPAIRRYEAAPLRDERTQYLESLSKRGTSCIRVRIVSTLILGAVRLLKLDVPRTVMPEEILRAGESWKLEHKHPTRNHGVQMFVSAARQFLRFHGLLDERRVPLPLFEGEFQDYLATITDVQGLAVTTIELYRNRTREFLLWFSRRKHALSLLDVNDVDDYLEEKRATISQRTISAYCNILKNFFYHAEARGWCVSLIGRAIRSPNVPKTEHAPIGPCWDDVKRLLIAVATERSCDLRARVIFVLCAVYGLRSSEVSRLRLDDFDWQNSTFCVTRSKNGRIQHFPIQDELGEAIVSYIRDARPTCSCRNLLVTLSPTYRKVAPAVLSHIVARKMLSLGIYSKRPDLTHYVTLAPRSFCERDRLSRRLPISWGIAASIPLAFTPNTIRNPCATSQISVWETFCETRNRY